METKEPIGLVRTRGSQLGRGQSTGPLPTAHYAAVRPGDRAATSLGCAFLVCDCGESPEVSRAAWKMGTTQRCVCPAFEAAWEGLKTEGAGRGVAAVGLG